MSALKLYRHPLSGNAHRAEVLLSLLGLDAELVEVDLMAGAQRDPGFLRLNAFGQVPVLEDGDITVADSIAILVYLASKYDPQRKWLPTDVAEAAQVQRFLAVAAGPVANGPGAARLVTIFGAELDHKRARDTAHKLLLTLNEHLAGRDWLVGDHPTIADVANYAYIAHAPEGEVSLQDYPEVIHWLRRFEKLPGFVPMQGTAVGLAA